MKIYADENIEHSIIEGLRRRRIEVIMENHIEFV